jgi:hypothetical protein
MRAKFSRLLILLLLFTALGLPVTVCVHAAEEVNIDELKEATNAAIESEGGSIFERIIGKTLTAIATGIKSFSYKVLGFKSLDTLIFNKGTGGTDVLLEGEWYNTMRLWYNRMRSITLPLVFVAVIITAFRFFKAAKNPRAREDAMEALLRLVFSSIIILFAPAFVSTLIRLNNYLVDSISALLGNSSIDQAVGLSPSMLDNIKTGSPVLTGFVILLLAGVELRINIMFFMRVFTITVLYIFTPFVAVLWAMEKSVNAAGVWLGEIISNIFMQFAYAFVFMVFLVFVPYMGMGGSIISVLVIVSVAEMIRNSVQNLWTRLSGLDEASSSFKIAGAFGAIAALPMLGKTIASQFGGLSTARTAAAKLLSRGGGSIGGGSSAVTGVGALGEGPVGGGSAVTASAMSFAADSTGKAESPTSGVYIPRGGGSINDARANAITGLGVAQALSNAAQFVVQGGTTVAMLPFGEAGQKFAQAAGYAAGTAVRAVSTPVALAGAAIKTSIKRGEGVKGIGRAYRESLGVRDRGKKAAARTAWRTVMATGRTAFGGVQSGISAVQQYGVDPLDGMRYY